MHKSEEVFTEIVTIQVARGITLGDAVVAYAEAADVDVEEVVKVLDPSALLQVKESLRDSITLKPSLRYRHRAPRLIF